MASPSRSCKFTYCRLQLIKTALFFAFFLSFSAFTASISESRKMGLGSHPPRCINRCMNCRPCMAVLVVPSSDGKLTPQQQQENYYLVSWKCTCKNKLFQP